MQFIHLGGDEVNPAWWNESNEITAYMAERGLGRALLRLAGRISGRDLAATAERHGKRIIGWDEALDNGAPEGMLVQSWRGATAARPGAGRRP